MNLLQTLLRPDREENPERAEVARAANLLQVGEFQILQLAYHAWYKQDLPPGLTDRLFHSYMIDNQVPIWARHYAQRIIELDTRGSLDDRDPAYHRYDRDYVEHVPRGTRKFVVAVAIVAGLLCGGLLFSHLTTGVGTSILPPYFEEHELMPRRPGPIPKVLDSGPFDGAH